MITDPVIWIGALMMGLSLGLLGSGGSILTVPLLVYVANEPEKIAIAESLLIVGIVALVGSIIHILKRNVDYKLALLFGLPSMFSAYLGAYLSQFVSAQFQMLLFAIVMLAASVFMLKPKSTNDLAKQSKQDGNPYVLIAAGLCVGVLAGLVGVGGGFLIVPVLLGVTAIKIHQAIATSLVIITMQSFAGFGKYAYLTSVQSLSFNIELITLVSICAVLGVFIGAWATQRLPQAKLKSLFGISLIPLSVFIFYSNI
ncbi:sulfite exporter TauE/SafE family protein [Glaciecola sp. SC05]|uniref:sulfite exporter TauE/SafE family protein n=1 Tax=Glaciecola sp. SC05 TaxID=1987355 RepID=UPI003526E248